MTQTRSCRISTAYITCALICGSNLCAEVSHQLTLPAQPDDNFSHASFSLKISDRVKAPRYLLVLLPGFNQNGNGFLKSKTWLDFAEESQAALIAVTFKSLDPKKPGFVHYAAAHRGTGAALETAIGQLDAHAADHKLQGLPLFVYGFSAGGQFAYGYSCHNPKRLIGFVAIKGGFYFPKPKSGTFDVPGLMISGHRDQERRRINIRRLFEQHRRQGAPWCWMEDNGGHRVGGTSAVVLPYIRQLLALRLPPGNRQPKPLDHASGVTIDLKTQKILHPGLPTPKDHTNPLTGYLPSRAVHEVWAKMDIGQGKYPSTRISRASQPIDMNADAKNAFFMEIAIGSEFGNRTAVIKKWQQPIRFKVEGAPTPEDRKNLAQVTAELKTLSKNIDIAPAGPTDAHNMTIHFIPKKQFGQKLNIAEKNINGYVTFWWHPGYAIRKSVVLIASDIRQSVRSCVLREEVAQALGLANETNRYPDSVFHARTDVSAFSNLDKHVIATLYRDQIKPGMTKEEVAHVLKTKPQP